LIKEYIYKIKFPVNNKIHFPVFAFFMYILYNNITDEIINIYDTETGITAFQLDFKAM